MSRTTEVDPVDRLDHDHVRKAAAWAAEQLALVGSARVRLAPGDMTEYKIQVTAPSEEWSAQGTHAGEYYWVTLSCGFGTGYEWSGHPIHTDYAASKWVAYGAPAGTRLCAGAAVGLFLTCLSQALRCRLEGHEPGEPVEVLELSEVRRCARCASEYVQHDDGTQAEVEA